MKIEHEVVLLNDTGKVLSRDGPYADADLAKAALSSLFDKVPGATKWELRQVRRKTIKRGTWKRSSKPTTASN